MLEKEDHIENNNKLRVLNDTFINRETGEEVEDITIMIDGKFKQELNIFVDNLPGYSSYNEVIREIISALLNK
ncbi:hypothetical protein [Cytobacillus praedii]|uniref:hypothetical protein n=1 Tax=Cytobacillus praedii TaxID=1742358 RepID=UPI002E242C86|nr:hypothetical protein [Cytobacillus praedii]